MKTTPLVLAILLCLVLAAAGVAGCATSSSSSSKGDDDVTPADDDDNDNDDATPDDDDDASPDDDDNDDNDASPDDDDNDDNDASPDDDDDDDDDSSPIEIILDDGSANTGVYMSAANTDLVQGFFLKHHPAKLLSAQIYVFGTQGATNQVELVVYYSTATKGTGPGSTTPVYLSAPFTVATTDGWNEFDLSDVVELQTPVATGELYVGFAYTVAGTGPSIGLDEQGLPNNDAWYQGGGTWYNVDANAGYPGVLMVRPTVEYEGSGDDDTTDDDDDNDDDDSSPADDDATPVIGYATGDTMPDFTEMSNSGANVSLTDFKGKIILLDSSAMWCPGCKAETPDLETEFYTPYQDTGPGLMVLQLLGQDVSGNTPTVAEMQSWATTYGLTFPVLADADWKVGGPIGDNLIPFYWVLDSNLKIVAKSDDPDTGCAQNHCMLSYFLPIVQKLLGVDE